MNGSDKVACRCPMWAVAPCSPSSSLLATLACVLTGGLGDDGMLAPAAIFGAAGGGVGVGGSSAARGVDFIRDLNIIRGPRRACVIKAAVRESASRRETYRSYWYCVGTYSRV